MIATIRIKDNPTPGLPFQEHALTHRLLDGLTGVEFGASAHNSFGLEGSINIAPSEGVDFYREGQVAIYGAYADIDLFGTCEESGLADDSQQYVITSHVVEHLPNPTAAFREWTRILKDGGLVLMIVPLPGALAADVGRPIATIDDIFWADGGITVDDWDYEAKPVPGGRRGHYWVYTIEAMKDIVSFFRPKWELVAEEKVDSKVGNGFFLAYKVSKDTRPIEEIIESEPESASEPVAEPVVEVEPAIEHTVDQPNIDETLETETNSSPSPIVKNRKKHG